ncbi:MAG: glycosyltransferase [Bacteroidales bacterium]|nr:glycosyltransferase [Bacteroidales bacterium]MBD5228976.1 glycosyltransferase [Bacteroidales bacterium]MBD5235297.1 glycosyltransferase [Barnesiella sp.]
MSLEELPVEALKAIESIKSECTRLKPLVVVSCITYNHEPYIREALDGFVSQKTDFPFVVVIHDDASTDNTANIIREYANNYPKIILPIFEVENQYSKRNGILGKIMHQARETTGAKYVAFCEGDDYWTDPLKLQKQVDFLENNPDYGLVSCGFRQYYQGRNEFGKLSNFEDKDLTYDDMLIINHIGTLSVCLRRDFYNLYRNKYAERSSKWVYGDYPAWIFVASQAKIRQLGEIMTVYRVLDNSASHLSSIKQKLNWVKTRYDVYDQMSQLAPVSEGTYYKAEYNRARLSWYIVALTKDKTLLNRVMKFYNENGFRKQALITKCMYLFPRLKRLWFYLDAKFAPTPRVYR